MDPVGLTSYDSDFVKHSVYDYGQNHKSNLMSRRTNALRAPLHPYGIYLGIEGVLIE